MNMLFGRSFGYALRALSYLAAQDGRTPLASHEIAKKRGMPERFLLKILKALVSHGILVSVKGPHGGYRLARPARSISLLEIYEATEGALRAPPPLDDKGLDKAFVATGNAVVADIKKRLGGIKLVSAVG
jgi:Rrf2 family protein